MDGGDGRAGRGGGIDGDGYDRHSLPVLSFRFNSLSETYEGFSRVIPCEGGRGRGGGGLGGGTDLPGELTSFSSNGMLNLVRCLGMGGCVAIFDINAAHPSGTQNS